MTNLRIAPYRYVLCVLSVFSGVALLIHILIGISLLIALAISAIAVALITSWLWHRSPPTQRSKIVMFASVGSLSGLVATFSYDVAKYVLSVWDPSTYNPFEAIRIFGVLLIGESAHEIAIITAGISLHLFNGVAFGIAYCSLFGQRGIIAGILWGIFLELFQMTLYPGWLDIRFYQEFMQISFLSHVMYGAVLGLMCRSGLRYTLKHDRLNGWR